jgi:hypothetical protein
MLAELLTLRFREDLRDVLRRRVMDVLGISPSDWAWRENAYRPRSIEGLASREFASGITITHGALARIGLLYLRGGVWNGRRILSEQYIREATRPAELPTFVPYYAFYWGSNARGTYHGMPKDAFWALGLGDSFVVVSPSLDIVAVRLGVGSNQSRLPGDPDDTHWGRRVEGFFGLVVQAIDTPAAATHSGASPGPYPPSPLIRGIAWAPAEEIQRKAKGSDNWPLTWAEDDSMHGAYGDGNGFEPLLPEKLSMGFVKLEGDPRSFVGTNIRSSSGEARGEGKNGLKASGLLDVEGTLYLLARNATNAQLAWSADGARTWTWAPWRFTNSFGCPTFLNFGRGYRGARDEFVYLYSPDGDSAYEPADRLLLARVHKSRLRQQNAYEYFAGSDKSGTPIWSTTLADRQAVFTHRGRCYRTSVTWNAPLQRYLLVQPIPTQAVAAGRGKVDTRFEGGLAVFDSPEPWGPWTTAYYAERWDVGPGDSASFPSKWIREDGRTLHLVFSGDDTFSLRRATLVVPSQ